MTNSFVQIDDNIYSKFLKIVEISFNISDGSCAG